MSDFFETFSVYFHDRGYFNLAERILRENTSLSSKCDIGYSDMVFSFFDKESEKVFLDILLIYKLFSGADFENF